MNNPRTTLEYFYHFEKEKANETYLHQPVSGEWREFTWAEVGTQARKMAAHLQSLGLPEKSNIGLVSKNCAHWFMADLAILMSGHISVPFYPTLVADQFNQVMSHSGCKVLFVGKLDDWKAMKGGVPEGVECIQFPNYYDGPGKDEFLNWDTVMAKQTPLLEAYQPKLDDLMSIVYTSGTTGVPKGVMLTYHMNATSIEDSKDILEIRTQPVRFFSYLPLCHIAERSLVQSGSIASGGTVYFAESIDSFAANLQHARPTHFLAVPRIWTRFQMGILAKMPQKKLDTFLKIPILSSLVKGKIKKGLGLDKARVIITGAAPMPVQLLQWFEKLGIIIQEAYGMTENMGAHTFTPRNARRSGTVGKLYPSVKTRIEPETSEIQSHSPWNTIGYYKEPEQTKQLLTEDGWLKTGDMGELTDEGYIKITGRVKDMFKTAKGEYVVPGPMEFGFASNTLIEQICVTGSILPQPIALVVLSEVGRAADRQEVAASLRETVASVNPNFKHYEHIKKVVVVSDSWTVENAMLTPTMKIKRNVVEKHYQPKMEGWFDTKDTVVWE